MYKDAKCHMRYLVLLLQCSVLFLMKNPRNALYRLLRCIPHASHHHMSPYTPSCNYHMIGNIVGCIFGSIHCQCICACHCICGGLPLCSHPPENCHFRCKNRLVAMINEHECTKSCQSNFDTRASDFGSFLVI